MLATLQDRRYMLTAVFFWANQEDALKEHIIIARAHKSLKTSPISAWADEIKVKEINKIIANHSRD